MLHIPFARRMSKTEIFTYYRKKIPYFLIINIAISFLRQKIYSSIYNSFLTTLQKSKLQSQKKF